jgi:hypothetical protein
MTRDVDIERAVDSRVQRRLSTDPRYRNAENAEEQSAAEEAITREVERELGVSDRGGAWQEMPRPTLTAEGREYATARVAVSLTANVALQGYEDSTWPEQHIALAIDTCNENGANEKRRARTGNARRWMRENRENVGDQNNCNPRTGKELTP